MNALEAIQHEEDCAQALGDAGAATHCDLGAVSLKLLGGASEPHDAAQIRLRVSVAAGSTVTLNLADILRLCDFLNRHFPPET